MQTPSFLIEFDDTQDNANHIHSVWRDFNGDFGGDLLNSHYEISHRNQKGWLQLEFLPSYSPAR
jgi:hypothetical protein